MANYDIKLKPGETVTITAEAAPEPKPVPVPEPMPAPTPSPRPDSLFQTNFAVSLSSQFNRGTGSARITEFGGRTCMVIDQFREGWRGETAVGLPNLRSIYAEVDIYLPSSLVLDGSRGGRHFFRVRTSAGQNNGRQFDIETNYSRGMQAISFWGPEAVNRNAFGDLPRDRWLTLGFQFDLDSGVGAFYLDDALVGSLRFESNAATIGYFAAASNWDGGGPGDHWYISRVQAWERKP